MGSSFFVANPQNIDSASRPAVTFFPRTRTWIVAYRRANTGRIHAMEFDIRCRPVPPSGGCDVDGSGTTVFEVTLLANPVDLGLATSRAPALSFIGDRLVLAFTAHGSSDVMVTTTMNGFFTSPGASISSESGAPYLHNSLGTLFLAVTDNPPTSTTDIRVLSSADGLTFAEVRRILRVGNPLVGGDIDAANAGPASEMIVAHLTHLQRTTTVWFDGTSTTLPTDTHLGVGLAHGPGPSHTTRIACSDPVLIARGSGNDATIPLNRSALVAANGDITLVCGSAASVRSGCPGNTTLATVSRASTGDAFIECWPR